MEPEKHTIKPVLPQPYRLIDEIVNKILSSTILKIQENEISTVQKTRTLYAQTTRHTTFEIDIPEKCLAIFSLSNVIICGTCNGLSIYNCETNDLIFTSNQSDVNIVFINAIELSNFHIFISAFDDFGKIYLYIYAIDKLFYLKDIDLNNDKSTVSNVDISKDLSNIVVTYLDMETNLHYLMVYTIPLFNWLREIDTNLNLVKSRLEILKSNESEPNTPILEEASSIRQNSIGNTNSPFTDQSLNQTTEEIYSFTKISLLFNLTTPGLLKGNNASNIINNHIKNKDSNINANGIPHGANHILSDQHLKNRNFIFEKDYKKYMQYLPKSNLNGNLKIPITRFVPPGKLIKSYENRGLIAVWTNHNGVYFYAFNKAKKDNEKKPENVWLTYGNIVTINFDEETLTFICATDNGIVSFWEYKSGICMGCVHTEHNDLISDLHLLNPDNVPNILKFQNKLNKKQKISLKTDKIDKSSEMDDILVKYKTVSALVVTSCCELFYIDSNGLNLDNNLKELILNSEINANKITSIVNINGKYLLLCLKDGSLISFNTDTCDYETSFESSPEYDISEPWKVVYSFNRRFGKLYIVVNSTKNNDAKICVFEITKELQIEKKVQKESKNFDQIVKSILEEM